jgi:hypothetical protein
MAMMAVALMAAVMTAAAVRAHAMAEVVAMAKAMAVVRQHRQRQCNKDNGGDSNGSGGKYNNQLKRGQLKEQWRWKWLTS